MKKTAYILLIYLFFFTSCADNKIDFSKTTTLEINPEFKNIDFLSQLFKKDYEVIVLESNKQSSYGRAYQIALGEKKLYILDKNNTHDILCFSRDGRFISRAKVNLEMQNKFASIGNFIWDKDNGRIEVIIDNPTTIICYDEELKFIEEINSTFYANQFSKDVNGTYYYFTNDFKLVREVDHNLIIKNSSNQIVSSYFETTASKNIFNRFLLKDNFYRSNKESILIQPFNYHIFGLKNFNIYSKYHIDFGDHKVPKDLSKQYGSTEFTKLREHIKKKGYAFNFQPVFESDDVLTFCYTYNDSWKNFFLYTKNTKKTYQGRNISNDINQLHFNALSASFCHETNSFIVPMSIHKLKKEIDALKKNLTEREFEEYAIKNKKLYNIYKTAQNTDNQILIIYKLKNL